MDQLNLYPLRFTPIYQYRLWGGHRLADLLDAPLMDDGPIGEAWVLSDRDDHESVVADGPLQGKTIGQLIKQSPEQVFGKFAGRFDRFPLLLKFLDAKEMLSVQVHPSDTQTNYLPTGGSGKTEAWVVLEVGPKARADVGLVPRATREILRQALAGGTVADHLAGFTPKPGDGIFLPAGTVHSFGDALIFEVEENSDVTFRLYDWDRVDPKTGKPRPLQIDQAMACVDFAQGVGGPVVPIIEETEPVLQEKLFFCKQFGLWRKSGSAPFTVGMAETPRVIVCLAGEGQLEYGGVAYALNKGDTLLLPAVVGACLCRPHGAITLLEISLPEGATNITT
jgi:mannose-6-phosphate isomerase